MRFFFIIFLEEGKKSIENPNNFLSNIGNKDNNSKSTFASSSIKLFEVAKFNP
jgi:hypothetical protein